MIQKFVDRYMTKKDELRKIYLEKRPDSYTEVVKSVITLLVDVGEYPSPDPERIHVIDDGDYQGTLIYIIGEQGYQPSKYWSVFVDYGSCSGCDTLEAIDELNSKEDQINGYMSLSLHVVQKIKLLAE